MSEDAVHGANGAEDIREVVRERYGSVARAVAQGATSVSCCGPAGTSGCCGSTGETCDPISSNLYDVAQTAGLPGGALLASLGCGNPTALAELHEGDVVLDLGSGGGIDVLLSAKRVGPTGKAYGLDMTDEMLALALENRSRAGVPNAEFLKGHIESIPLPSNTVDVIISNCVINLSGDKRTVLAESFRVLKPGGRFAVSDVIVRGGLPDVVKASMPLWTGCVAGALEEQEFIALLTEAGFEHATIEPTRVYTRDDAAALLAGTGLDATLADEVSGRIMSGFVRATKPRGPRPAAAIRPATPNDLPAIERLLAGADLPTSGVAEIVMERPGDFCVAETNAAPTRIVAVAGLEVCGDTAVLRSVAVEPEWRSHGLGHELVRHMVCDAEGRGLRALYLLTMTAEHYFPRFGFERIERSSIPRDIADTVEFKSACPATAVAMVRAITPT
ncbi:MAG TPA: arsenic resistance N-acetyltransferase ArsN2 [Gemmatimonadaceae bacterium]